MTEDVFQSTLDDLFERVQKYEVKFGNTFEICFLIPEAVQQYRAPTIISSYIQRDPFDCYTYLHGRKVVFLECDYIPTFTSDYSNLIEPVICCSNTYGFPMNAEIGDYIIYRDQLKQVVATNIKDGGHSINIKEIKVNMSNDPTLFNTEAVHSNELVERWLNFTRRRERQKDMWMDSVDNLEINNYLSSLTII